MSEEAIAKKIGAELVSNSGRGLRKGDMKFYMNGLQFLIDAKEGASFAFTEKAWAKVCTDAATYGYDWIPMILRVTNSGSMIACIPFDDLIELIDERDVSGW